MSDLPSKLEALGDLLDVDDDTQETERPEPRRAVGDVLAGRQRLPDVERAPDTEPLPNVTDPDAAIDPPPSSEPSAAAAAAQPGPPPRERRDPTGPRTTEPVRQRAKATDERERGTSANLPIELVERLQRAKQRRWELSPLIASALANLDVDLHEADRTLQAHWGEIRVQRAYRLAATDLTRLDALAERWRMNRSQVLTVIVPLELDRLQL